jgi:SNF2 family DNA or RNA helicase
MQGVYGRNTVELRPYQSRMAEQMIERPVLGLFADMGVGKTLITLKALEQIKGKTLLIAPIRVCETVWRQEAKKWGVNLTFSLIRGTLNERISALKQNTDIYLINPDLIAWLFDLAHLPAFNVLVIDESSLFKNPSTKRFKTIKKNLKRFDRRYILTGTPSPNSLMDLWSQIGILDKGERLGTAFGRFKDTYFESDYMGYKWTIRPRSKERIEQLLADIILRLDAEDYLTLPEMLEVNVIVNLSDKEMKQYKQFTKDMVTRLGGKELTAVSAVTLHGKLSQLANGMVYDEDQKVHMFHRQKLIVLEEMVEELDSPVIIVYKYNHEKEEILKLFPDATIFSEGKTEDHVSNWNAGKIKHLLLHPMSGGHGINLQEGGNHIIWFSPIPSSEQYLQTNKRIHRPGQTKPVFIHRLITEGTVDEVTAESLKNKELNQINFLNAMKKLISEHK